MKEVWIGSLLLVALFAGGCSVFGLFVLIDMWRHDYMVEGDGLLFLYPAAGFTLVVVSLWGIFRLRKSK